MIDIVKKIDSMRVKRGWTIYQLSQMANLSQQTYHSWVDKNATPSIPALKNICNAFGITMAELFAENKLIEVTPEIEQLYDDWSCLNEDEKNSVIQIVKNYLKNK